MPPHLAHMTHHSRMGYRAQQFPVIMTDDLVSGTQHNGKMSPVRRFFILLCTFDILLTTLLWIIAILVTGRDLTRELHQQVMEYTIHSSMFDCVMAAGGRFLVCLSFYGLLDMSHWWPITVTTAGTLAFLIAKVFEYQVVTLEYHSTDYNDTVYSGRQESLLLMMLCWCSSHLSLPGERSGSMTSG